MIWTFKISTGFAHYEEEYEGWEGTLEIDSSSTLEDLHLAIQDAVEFENDHLYAFYIARTNRSTDRIWLDDENEEIYTRTLESLYPLPKNRKLFYLFDFGDSWTFQVTKSRKKPRPPEKGVNYPRLIGESGEKLHQYPDFEDDDWELDDGDLQEYVLNDTNDFSHESLRMAFESSKVADHGMGLYETYGFVLSVVSAPVLITPSEWIPEILTNGEGDEFEFESREEGEQLLGNLMKLWTHWNEAIDEGITLPKECMLDKSGNANEALKAFCNGYLMGHGRLLEDWEEVFQMLDNTNDSEAKQFKTLVGGTLLINMLLMEGEEVLDSHEDINDFGLSTQEAFETYPQALTTIALFARQISEIKESAMELPEMGPFGQQPYYSDQKIGRNDPCPCGSGKKYKKCCLH